MKKEDKNKLYVIFILVMFFGSTFAFAIQYAPQLLGSEAAEEKKSELVYSAPLSSAEEAGFLRQNYVIVRYYYSDTCLKCDFVSQQLDKIFSDLNQKVIIEKINTGSYKNESEDAGVTSVPFFILKGRTVDKFEYKSSNDLFVRICDAYIQTVDECAFK